MPERFGTIPRGSHPGSVSTPPRPPPLARATGEGRPQFDTERPVPETPPATLEGDDEEQASFSQGGSSLLDGATAQPQQSRDTASPVGGSHSAAKRGRARVCDDEHDPSEPSTFCQVLYRNWKGTWGQIWAARLLCGPSGHRLQTACNSVSLGRTRSLSAWFVTHNSSPPSTRWCPALASTPRVTSTLPT